MNIYGALALLMMLSGLVVLALLVRRLSQPDKPGVCRICGERTRDQATECFDCWQARQW